MDISSKRASDSYVHRSKQIANQETYLKECTDKRLLPQISFEWKLFDLAKAHYSNIVQERLTQKNFPFVSYVDNPLNVPQARPIEIAWTVLE